MTAPTDADRIKATKLYLSCAWAGLTGRANAARDGKEAIAAALADARAPGEKLRADLLALADEMDDELAAQGVLLDRCIRPGDRLRALVEDQP